MDRRSTPTDPTASGPAPRFNAPLWIVLGAMALTAVLYWPTSVELPVRWGKLYEPYAHGWLVLAVTVWLIWRDRAQLARITLVPPSGGWLVVALGSVGWLVTYNAGVLAASMMALPLLALATVWAAGGLVLVRRVAVPVLLFYLAVPVWEIFSPPLQWMTTTVNHWLTELVGIPVVMREYVISIPAGTFAVEGGCSGLNYFVTALFIAVVLGELDRDDLSSRLMLVALGVGLALLTNWLRVFIIIVAGHLTNMQHYLVKVEHYKFGWVLFAFLLVFYFWLARRLPRRDAGEPALAQRADLPSSSRRSDAVLLSAIGLALGPLWSHAQPMLAGAPAAAMQPPTVPGWSGPERYLSNWKPVFLGADEEFLVAYVGDEGREAAVYRAAYHSQRQGKELRAYGNSVAGESRRVQATGHRQVEIAERAVAVTEETLSDWSEQQSLVWWLYAVDGKPSPMDLPGQLSYGVRSMWRAPTASVVAITAECRPDCDAARVALDDISRQLLPALLTEPSK
jgi:EpsI family protein